MLTHLISDARLKGGTGGKSERRCICERAFGGSRRDNGILCPECKREGSVQDDYSTSGQTTEEKAVPFLEKEGGGGGVLIGLLCSTLS